MGGQFVVVSPSAVGGGTPPSARPAWWEHPARRKSRLVGIPTNASPLAGGESASLRAQPVMGRQDTAAGGFNITRPGAGWHACYREEWAGVVGGRIRRLRTARGMTLGQLVARVPKPGGGYYSGGYLSRIERGWGSAPLYVYVSSAHALGTEPGRLLG